MKRSFAAVAAACLIALGSPAQADARVTITVEFVYGGVAVGGMGIFIALSGSWEALAAQGGIPDALLEVDRHRVRYGMPFAPLGPSPGGDAADLPPADGLLLNLVRWRF